jgi:hypothetical protein
VDFSLGGRHAKLGWVLALVICAAYLAFFVHLTSFPLQDYPNHVARGVVMDDLMFHHGARFGQQFAVRPMAVPYILGDLIMAGSIELFGTVAGAGVFMAIVLLALPCALLFYMRVNRLAPQARLFVFLLGLYLSTDWFLLMGFMAFRLAVAAVVFTLALADLVRRRWSVPLFAAYAGALAVCYLTHLSWLVFFAVVLGVSGAIRWWFATTTIKREIGLMAPVLLLFAWQFFLVPPQGNGTGKEYGLEWGGLLQKLNSLLMEFQGFGGHLAEPLILLLGLCILWPIRHSLSRQAWAKPVVLEQLAIALAFVVVYLAMPRETQYAAFIDLRALPMIVLFIIFAVLYVPPEDSAGRDFGTTPAVALVMLLAVGNLAYLMYHVGQNNAWMSRYRAVVQQIPAGATVLSIYADRQTDTRPFLHAGSFVVLDRGGITPYLFSGDRGDPMVYFRYLHRPYRPEESWYDAQRLRKQTATATETAAQLSGTQGDDDKPWYADTAPPDWSRVACDYDFLLITVPFDPQLIEVKAHTVAENHSVALLKVDSDKQNCRRGHYAGL